MTLDPARVIGPAAPSAVGNSSWQRLYEISVLGASLLGYRAVVALLAPVVLTSLGPKAYAEIAVAENYALVVQILAGGFIAQFQGALMARGLQRYSTGFWMTAVVVGFFVSLVAAGVLLLLHAPLAIGAAVNGVALALNAAWVFRVMNRLSLFLAITLLQSALAAAVILVSCGVESPMLYLCAQPLAALPSVIAVLAMARDDLRPRLLYLRESLPMLPFQLAVGVQLASPLFVVAALADDETTSEFGALSRTIVIFLAASSLVAAYIAPRVAGRRLSELRLLRRRITQLSVLYIVGIGVGLLALKQLLPAVYGNNLAVLLLLALQGGIAARSQVSRMFCLREMAHAVALLQGAGALIQLVMLVPLVCGLGAFGAALALVLTEALLSIAYYVLARRNDETVAST